ncbi:MAG: glycosyltransferase [Pseudomonadota bacterium]|nr:glycosyltransferase [Pseudomonadota bacterium]
MRILHLYRPRVPATRAQSVQVVHTCHALAKRGHTVTLLCDRADAMAAGAAGLPEGADPGDPTAALLAYGLDHPETLDLRIAPVAWPPGAGWWFRWQLARWEGDIVYARAKRYVARIPMQVPVVIEAHEVDSALAHERGEDPAPHHRLEASVYARSVGVVANCGGTLALLAATHALPERRAVIHNGTRADRAVVFAGAPGAPPVVGYTGSPRAYKGLATVLASLPLWPGGAQLELIGGAPHGAALPPNARAFPSVPYGALPARLARYDALLLPLDDNLFGRALTSPLKLWDYLATGIPIVAADLPTTREIGGDALHYYPPGDAAGLAAAVARALAAPRPAPKLRTWDDRAAEIEAFLLGCLA